MPKHNYKLESTSSTTSGADGGLTQKRNGLVKKLGSKKVSTEVELIKSEFTGNYSKNEENGDKIRIDAEFKSKTGWKQVTQKAQKKLLDLAGYNMSFTKAEYLFLTEAQLDAVTEKRPPAGLDNRQTSYITSDISALLA